VSVVLVNSGVGQELREHIERVLNLPPQMIGFELRFYRDEALTVKCEFYPQARDDPTGGQMPQPPLHGGL
jgi:hypothetical protein